MNSSLREIMWPRKQTVATPITGVPPSPKKGVPAYLWALGTKPADMSQKPIIGHGVSELAKSGRKEGKENGKLRENIEMSILLSEKESECRAKAVLSNSVAISHVGLFK